MSSTQSGQGTKPGAEQQSGSTVGKVVKYTLVTATVAGAGYYVTHKEECDAMIAEAQEAWTALAPAVWYGIKKGTRYKINQLRRSIAEAYEQMVIKITAPAEDLSEPVERDIEPVYNEDEIDAQKKAEAEESSDEEVRASVAPVKA